MRFDREALRQTGIRAKRRQSERRHFREKWPRLVGVLSVLRIPLLEVGDGGGCHFAVSFREHR